MAFLGVTKRMPLCRCSVLYQRVNVTIHERACATDGKARWEPGRYLSVQNSDSEKGLSLLTLGRLNDVATPSDCSVASNVAPHRTAVVRVDDEIAARDPHGHTPPQ